MTPTTKTKFSERFSAKVNDIRSKSGDKTSSQRNQTNAEPQLTEQSPCDKNYELMEIISRIKTVKTIDEATITQLELQSMMLMTLKAMDWKLWEMYNKAGKNN